MSGPLGARPSGSGSTSAHRTVLSAKPVDANVPRNPAMRFIAREWLWLLGYVVVVAVVGVLAPIIGDDRWLRRRHPDTAEFLFSVAVPYGTRVAVLLVGWLAKAGTDLRPQFTDQRCALAFERYLTSGSGCAFVKRHLR